MTGKTNDQNHQARILIVDDHPGNRLVASTLVEECGCGFALAQNGQEAVELVKTSDDFDAILMDVQMPIMDGLEATMRIREHEKKAGKARVPIIALTAHPFPSDQQSCLAAGMDDYLYKPLDPDKLKNLITRVILRGGGGTISVANR